jgi:hypothetical protein
MTLSQSDLPTLIRAKKTFKCGNVSLNFATASTLPTATGTTSL